MAATTLAITKHPGNLIDTSRARRQQAFHVIFRGGLQPAARNSGSVDGRRDTVEVDIGDAMPSEHRRFDLQNTPLCKKAAHPG